jgi:hypothetical protein
VSFDHRPSCFGESGRASLDAPRLRTAPPRTHKRRECQSLTRPNPRPDRRRGHSHVVVTTRRHNHGRRNHGRR